MRLGAVKNEPPAREMTFTESGTADLVAHTTMWGIGSHSVGSGPGWTSVDPGQPGYVGSPPNQPTTGSSAAGRNSVWTCPAITPQPSRALRRLTAPLAPLFCVKVLASVFVVVTGLENDDVVALDQVHEPVFVVYSPGPTATQNVPEGLRLSNAGEGIPERVIQEAVDPLDHCLVSRLPVPVVLPAVGSEDQPHQGSS